MIILKTNLELKTTFERLIKTMREPVEWNGRFVIIADYLILEGRVRSLFFQFDNRKVNSNLIEIPEDQAEIIEMKDQTKAQNVLNMVLYAFGKWGLIRGVKVEQDFAQLNGLFTSVLQDFSVEPGYSNENFRFYKRGIRITYEDVIQLALDADEKTEEEMQTEVDPVSAGLWHKLVWKKQNASFSKTETTLEQRQKNRLGNNFYLVGYHCPKCGGHLHMAVYPEGKEFRIESSEGGVFIARAYTCGACHCFYTPRPEKLLAEGDVYAMDFVQDAAAYDDYKELLGKEADRVSNFKYNEYEAVRKRKDQLGIVDEKESLEELYRKVDTMTDRQLFEIAEKMEEGFYPMGSMERFEEDVKEAVRKRTSGEDGVSQGWNAEDGAIQGESAKNGAGQERRAGNKSAQEITAESGINRERPAGDRENREMADQNRRIQRDAAAKQPANDMPSSGSMPEQPQDIPAPRREAARKRYEAKSKVLERLSPSQVSELKKELLRDRNLYDSEKEPFLKAISKKENQILREKMQKLAAGCMGQKYLKIRRSIEEIEKIDLPVKEKETVLSSLYEERKKRGEAEAAELLSNIPEHLDMKQYKSYMERLNGYTEVDLSPYENLLEEKKKQAQGREIANLIRHGRTTDRSGLTALMERLKKQGFDEDVLTSYMEKLEEKLRIADENTIADICGNPTQMSIADTMEAYRKIEEGEFLPDLKKSALERMKKRLARLKTEECALLVHKFQDNLTGRIEKNPRFHFYRVKEQTEEGQEKDAVIEYALDTYGTARGDFEYPILVVDTSRDRSGKEGMILTPDHLFYRTMLNAYEVSIEDIKGLRAQPGLFHAGLFLQIKGGEQVKIPYAVDRKELVAWGNCLEEFIHYLQEKPDSRKVTYLAEEKHETICCFRCGFSYKEGNVCPKCGYKMNQ